MYPVAVERRRLVDGWRNRDLKKSELSQGGLEKQDREANPRGRDCRFCCLKEFQRTILVLTVRAPDFDVYQPSAVWIYPAKLECILIPSLSADIGVKRGFPGTAELGRCWADCITCRVAVPARSSWHLAGVAPGPLTEPH